MVSQATKRLYFIMAGADRGVLHEVLSTLKDGKIAGQHPKLQAVEGEPIHET